MSPLRGITGLLSIVGRTVSMFWVGWGWTSSRGIWLVIPEQTMPGQAVATGRPLCGPASGHPERLVPDVPLSGCERALWAQLADLRAVDDECYG